MSALATTLQASFTDRLVRQRQVSPNTVQSCRDTLRLLLVFASEQYGKAPGKLGIDDLDAPVIGAFLDHLEHERQNGVRTRNARLAAIRSPFRYAALRHPEHAATIERVVLRNDRLLCDTGAALRHLTHAGERRGTDRKNGGLSDRSEVGSPLPFA